MKFDSAPLCFLLCLGWLMATGARPVYAQGLSASPLDPLDQWHWRNPQPQGNPLDSVEFCHETFFALGPQGTLVTSPDGTTWTSHPIGIPADLKDVAWAAGRYVLVGQGGLVLTSTTGSNWIERPSGTFSDLQAVTYGKGMFIAVGDRGTILTSADGSDWTLRAAGGTIFRDVAFNGSQFMVVGYDDTTPASQGSIYTSGDGVLWSRRNPPFNGRFSSVAAGNGLFVVVGGEGNILTSPEGGTWFSHSTDFMRMRGVTAGSGLFVAVGESTVFVSSDGLNWLEPVTLPPEVGHDLVATAHGNGRFVAVGGEGAVLSSPNARNWTNHTSVSIDGTLRGLAFGGGNYVAVGDRGTILGSNDGQHWQRLSSGTVDPLMRVAFGGGVHVVVGPPHRILISSNGLDWTARDSGIDEVLLDLVYANGRFVAVGINGSILVSANGMDWTQSSTWKDGLNGITWSDGLFLAAGNLGVVITSVDGLNWSPHSTGRSATLSSMAAGNGLYVAVGDYGLVLTSTNLVDWSAQNLDSSLFLRQVQYAQGRFVAAGFSFNNPGATGHVLTSTDGSTWTFREVPAVATPLTAVGVAAGTFFVLGDRGTILQSDPLGPLPPVLSLVRGPGGCPSLTLAGVMGGTYRIESTFALRPSSIWQARTNLTLDARVMSWTDPQCMTGRSLVYRAVAVP